MGEQPTVPAEVRAPLPQRLTDDISDIEESYNRSVEEEHSRLERHQLEYDLTWR